MKTTTCELITPDETKQVRPDSGATFELKEIQDVVGGYIEVVNLPPSELILICNEDGIGMGLPLNRRAMARIAEICKRPFGEINPIVGNVVICERTMLE